MGLFQNLRNRVAAFFGGAPRFVDGEVVPVMPDAGEFLDLELRREAATARHAEAMVSPAGVLIDSDDHVYRRVTSGSRFRTRDLTPLQHDRMLEIAWYLMEANAFAKRLITLMADLVVGEGITVSAKDPVLDELLQKIWKHPINRLGDRAYSLYLAGSVNGELVLPLATNPITGIPHIGYIDPLQVARVKFRDDNVLVPEQVILKANLGAAAEGGGEGARLQIVQEDPITNRLGGEVFYWTRNAMPNSSRGRSDLLTLADWLDLYDQLMFAEVERVKLLSSFVWDLKMENADEKTIKKRMDEFGTPSSGTVFGHNQKEELKATTPNLNAADRAEVGKTLAIHIAGSHGFPISWLGFTDSNRSTIEGQNDVMAKTPSARQKEFVAFLGSILRFGIESAMAKNPALYRGITSTEFTINVPEIQAKDIARVGGVISSIVSAMDTAQMNGTMSKRAATVVVLAAIKHLGVDLDLQEVMKEAEAEQRDRQASEDERAANLARALAAKKRTDGKESPDDVEVEDEAA